MNLQIICKKCIWKENRRRNDFNLKKKEETNLFPFWFLSLRVIVFPIFNGRFIHSAASQASNRIYLKTKKFSNHFVLNKNKKLLLRTMCEKVTKESFKITKRSRRNSIRSFTFLVFLLVNSRKSFDKTSQYWKRCDYLLHFTTITTPPPTFHAPSITV